MKEPDIQIHDGQNIQEEETENEKALGWKFTWPMKGTRRLVELEQRKQGKNDRK